MSGSRVILASFQPAVERAIAHLLAGQDTALIAAGGCGLTTLRSQMVTEIRRRGAEVAIIDFREGDARLVRFGVGALPVPPSAHEELVESLSRVIVGDESQTLVVIVDHANTVDAGGTRTIFNGVHDLRLKGQGALLWLGPFDARTLAEAHGLRLHAVPRSHICLPSLTRDDALAAYRAIAEENDCRWGDAILFLLLDLCGNDLALAASIAEYLHGSWTEKLYDASVWDRVADWLAHARTVAAYRDNVAALDDPAIGYLKLVLQGGKPRCQRADLLEEPDSAIRALSLRGFIVPNLLPGFYQLRSLTVRYLVEERLLHGKPARPENLFRRVTNDRAAQLLQDVEMMLRSIVRSAMMAMPESDVRAMLEAKRGDAELMPASLNRDLLAWSAKQQTAGLRESLSALLLEHRKAFRDQNSIWSRVERMMQEDADDTAGENSLQERAVDYLTFAELGDFVLEMFDRVLPGPYRYEPDRGAAKERWRDSLSKVRRLRNRVAHHRNVDFQDMEDLAGTIDRMRRDLFDHGAWR